MDLIDRKILGLLQEDASLSVSEIASRVGLSTTPCWKRINKLREDGVILRQVALCDPVKLGLGLTVFVRVVLRHELESAFQVLAQAIQSVPEIVECYRMSGEEDYILRAVVENLGGYDVLHRRLLACQAVLTVQASFAMERVKYTTALPTVASEHMPPRASLPDSLRTP